jgi:MFS family permease
MGTARQTHGGALALGLVLLAGLVNYIDRVTLSLAAPQISAEFHLRPGQTGVLLSAFLWAYAAAQAPVGALTDRLGARPLLGAAMALWSAAQAATGLVSSLGQMILARVVLGVGEAPQFPVGARVARTWFAPKDRGLATGVFNSASTLGPALAPPIVTLLIVSYGWRGAFIATGLAGLVTALIWLSLYRDRHGEADAAPAGTPWRRLLRSPTLWAMAAGNFGSGYMTWFFAAWLPSYLETGRHFTVLQTGWAAALPYVFGFAGSLAGGYACDRLAARGLSVLASRKAPIVAGLGAAAMFTALAIVAPSDGLALAMVCGALMFANVATASIWALAVVAAPDEAVASVGAMQNLGGLLGGALAPIVTGLTLEATGSFGAALGIAACAALAGGAIYLLGVTRPIGG